MYNRTCVLVCFTSLYNVLVACSYNNNYYCQVQVLFSYMSLVYFHSRWDSRLDEIKGARPHSTFLPRLALLPPFLQQHTLHVTMLVIHATRIRVAIATDEIIRAIRDHFVGPVWALAVAAIPIAL